MIFKKLSVLTSMLVIALFAISGCGEGSNEKGLYLGSPYISNPLGDGEEAPYTPGLLWRKDGFDCVTYVETLLVDKRANKGKNFEEQMKLIRYIDSEVGFFTRAHFTEYDWIPNAIKHGFISAYSYPVNTVSSDLKMDHAEWFKKNPTAKNIDENFMSKAETFKPFEISIPFVSREKINIDFLKKLDDEMVVVILKKFDTPVMPGQIGGGIFVTHLGMLFDKKQFIHASSTKGVVSLPLLEYLENNKSIYGMAFYTVNK